MKFSAKSFGSRRERVNNMHFLSTIQQYAFPTIQQRNSSKYVADKENREKKRIDAPNNIRESEPCLSVCPHLPFCLEREGVE